MLVLSRKSGQRIQIGPDVTIIILRVSGNVVKIGCQAPAGIAIDREEVRQRIEQEQAAQIVAAGAKVPIVS